MIKRLIVLSMLLACTILPVEADKIPLVDFKEQLREDFLITRDTYTKQLFQEFRKDFMKEISSELRTLVKSQLFKLKKEVRGLSPEEKKKIWSVVQKLFVQKFFFENEAWLNSVMNQFKLDLRQHNKDTTTMALDRQFKKIKKNLDKKRQGGKGTAGMVDTDEYSEDYRKQARDSFGELIMKRFQNFQSVFILEERLLVQTWVQGILDQDQFYEEIKQLKANWDQSPKEDSKTLDPTLFKTSSGMDYTIDKNFKNTQQHPNMDNEQDKILIDWLQQAFENSSEDDKNAQYLEGKSIDDVVKDLLTKVSLDERYYIEKYLKEFNSEASRPSGSVAFNKIMDMLTLPEMQNKINKDLKQMETLI